MENLKKDRKSAILKLAQDIANVEGGIYMATFRILIDSVDKALDFNKIVDQCEFNVDLVNGRTYVDAKSLFRCTGRLRSLPMRTRLRRRHWKKGLRNMS